MKNRKHKIYASLETFGVLALLLLLLYFVTISSIEEEDVEVEIVFDNARMGGVRAALMAQQVNNTSSNPSSSSVSSEKMLTQEEESMYVPSADELERQREAAEAKKKAEQERMEEERLLREKARAEAEQKAREQRAIDKANALGALFGNTKGSEHATAEQGEGVGEKGNPVGHGSLNGNSWSLDGRDCIGLPRPSNNFKQEGTVIVLINVNELGEVVSARVGGGDIGDAQTREIARKAALKAKFSPAESKMQMGKITYIFKFK